jgi:hypothetical protein
MKVFLNGIKKEVEMTLNGWLYFINCYFN